MTPQFHIKIENGQIAWKSPSHRAQFFNYISRFEGKECILTCDVPKNVRSLTQNAYMWVYLSAIEAETGTPAPELHEWFKRKFLPPRLISFHGQEMKIPGSTTNLSKTEMGEYLDKISALTEIPLPDPVSAGYHPS